MNKTLAKILGLVLLLFLSLIYIFLIRKGIIILIKLIGSGIIPNILIIFLLTLFSLIIFVVIVLVSICLYKSTSPYKYLQEKISLFFTNGYLRLAFALVLMILIVGISTLDFIYQNDLPLTENWEENGDLSLTVKQNIVSISEYKCHSKIMNYNYYVKEDRLSCSFSIIYSNTTPAYFLKFVEVDGDRRIVNFEQQGIVKDYSFEFNVPDLDLVLLPLTLVFQSKDGDTKHFYYSQSLIMTPLTTNDYRTREGEKILWLLGLITGTITLVFSMMTSLKELTKP